MQEFRNNNHFRSYMKKEADRIGISPNGAYSTFFARALIDKINKYNNGSILVKGSSAETAYIGTLVRGITDVDLALLGPVQANMDLFNYVLEDKSDPISFKISREPKRTRTGIIQVSLKSSLYGVDQTIKVDLQENYNRLIEREKRKMPIIFNGDLEYPILVPSFEEYIAEKVSIILGNNKEDVLNTRVKDFYDIYELHGTLNYDPKVLCEYFPIMLEKIGRVNLQDATTLRLDRDFIKRHTKTWADAIKSYEFIDAELFDGDDENHENSFTFVVGYTRSVIRQLLQANGIEMPVYVKTKSNDAKHI